VIPLDAGMSGVCSRVNSANCTRIAYSVKELQIEVILVADIFPAGWCTPIYG